MKLSECSSCDTPVVAETEMQVVAVAVTVTAAAGIIAEVIFVI